MELIHALRLEQNKLPPRVAFVGAGGKTTAMFRCARELAPPVLITATAHLAVEQLALADQHYFMDEVDLENLAAKLTSGVILLIGPKEGGTGRTLGVFPDQLGQILALADADDVPLLIEADGSQRLPLKAPADHEPPIPKFVDTVVVVAGLSGLGHPLSSEWIFRPEIFAAISGLELGAVVSAQALTRVMLASLGGLKNIPAGARRIALLNQADTPELQAQTAAISADLLSGYHAVVISSLSPQSGLSQSKNVVHAVHEPVAGVILAAGEARRFGSPKQLLKWRGKPLVWHVAQQALQAGLNPVKVVCGSQWTQIQQALADLPIQTVYNADWSQGQGTSVRAGVEAVSPQSGGILFLLADQPQIPVTLIRKLVHHHAQSLSPITGPLVNGQRGNPVLFDRLTFAELGALSGNSGGRALFAKYPVQWIPWHDASPLLDIDTPEDYQRLLEMDG